jgi:hypothetical protein
MVRVGDRALVVREDRPARPADLPPEQVRWDRFEWQLT